jgi:hypothetical protein
MIRIEAYGDLVTAQEEQIDTRDSNFDATPNSSNDSTAVEGGVAQ